jgi:hypothetical protein
MSAAVLDCQRIELLMIGLPIIYDMYGDMYGDVD